MTTPSQLIGPTGPLSYPHRTTETGWPFHFLGVGARHRSPSAVIGFGRAQGAGNRAGNSRTVTSSWKPTPDQRVYCWVAGESGLPTGLRRHLVKEGGVPKSDISFLGYWRHGRSSHG
ncbi:SIP domain-containing protein [Streptomyces sp. NPDC014892]|uniref:SIP domain-containing protein n=1 Tax=Streptomyces sp. NPDC014892 TaxID=3364930 RepID=UPI0036F83F89